MINRDFILAGKAIFTVYNASGEHYTYKVKRKEGDGVRPDMFFVMVLSGPDNNSDYTYMGCLSEYTGKVRLTGASRFTAESKSYKVLNWALGLLWHGRAFPEGYGIKHEGRCGVCGRRLTTPESIDRGIGPECFTRIGG